MVVKNIFDHSLFQFPPIEHYLDSADPNNEILVDSYINIENGIFIDIGAFIGKYSIKIARRPKVKVLAIEPNPDSFKILCANAEINRIGSNFIPHKQSYI